MHADRSEGWFGGPSRRARALQDVPQGLLAAEDNFKRQVFFDAGYEKPQIGQALGSMSMGLVDEQECELFILFEAGKDLKQHASLPILGFSPSWVRMSRRKRWPRWE